MSQGGEIIRVHIFTTAVCGCALKTFKLIVAFKWSFFFISAYMKNNAANHHSHHIKQNNVCLFSEREWTVILSLFMSDLLYLWLCVKKLKPWVYTAARTAQCGTTLKCWQETEPVFKEEKPQLLKPD